MEAPMSVYKPKFKDATTGELRECPEWWYDFSIGGRRIRESAKTTSVTRAREAEKRRRAELEGAYTGAALPDRKQRIRSAADVVDEYLEKYRLEHHGRPKSIAWAEGRLAHVKRLLGKRLMPDLRDERVIRGYVAARRAEHVSGRTINMEVGELSRAIGAKWSVLWPGVKHQEEARGVGRALSPAEEARLLEAAGKKDRWRLASTIIRVLLMTAMRCGEVTGAKWEQIDFEQRIFRVGTAKTSSGTGREIPMNADLVHVLQAHAAWFTGKFGPIEPEQYVFPFGRYGADPRRPMLSMKTAWRAICAEAGVKCRIHDLRHCALTKLAEAGVAESTLLALAGHMSRAMLERYSHIRVAAKREAVEALTLAPPVSNKTRQSTAKVVAPVVLQ
jgi:integrase